MSTRYHQAASDSYLELLKEATKRDLNLSDKDGTTPTLLAAYHGNLEALEIICSRGGDPDRCDIWGNTPLHHAASNGHAHCVSFLINFGANIFALDNDLRSPLEAAASRERGDCVALLDHAATAQNIANPRKVARLKEQAQRSARRQIKECERLQERHQEKMARAHHREDPGPLPASSAGAAARASGTLGSLSKGIKDTFRIKFKKSKDTAAGQGGEGSRSTQRNVMEVFAEEEEEEDRVTGDLEEKLRLSAEDGGGQHESILSRPGLGSIVFRSSRLLGPEDVSGGRGDLGFHPSSELLQREVAAATREAEAAEEDGAGDGLEGGLPWDGDEVEWEEDALEASALEVFLQCHGLDGLLPFLTREQMDLEALLLCSDEDLQGIQVQLGPRKKVLGAVSRRKQALQQPGPLVDTSL